MLHFSSLDSARADMLSTLRSNKGPSVNKPIRATTETTAFKNNGGGPPSAKTVCQTGAKLALRSVIKEIIAKPCWYSSEDVSDAPNVSSSTGFSCVFVTCSSVGLVTTVRLDKAKFLVRSFTDNDKWLVGANALTGQRSDSAKALIAS